MLPFDITAGVSAVDEIGGALAAQYEGGDGADGLTSGNGNGNDGFSPGGGGSGAHKSSGNSSGYAGGSGGDGQVRIIICEFFSLTSTTAPSAYV